MADVTSSIEVPAAPERVWDAITDLQLCPDWLVIHAGFPEGIPDALAEGVSYKQTVKIMGMSRDVTWTVSEIDEPRRLVYDGKGPVGIKLRAAYVLEPAGDGTRVGYEGRFGGLALRPLGSQVEKEAVKAGERSLENLRELVARSGR